MPALTALGQDRGVRDIFGAVAKQTRVVDQLVSVLAALGRVALYWMLHLATP